MTETEYEVRRGYWHGESRVIALPADTGTVGLTYDFPGVELFKLESVAFVVTTAAGGGARQVVVSLVDALGVAVFANAAPATQAGGTTVQYGFGPDVAAFGSAALGFIGGVFTGSRLPGNMTFRVQVVSAAAGDQVFNARLLVCQYDYVQPRD